MLRLKKIAVTGLISSGKSLACLFFKKFGAYTLSSDEIVHKLLSLKSEISHKVIQLLGSEILDGSILDRQKIAKKVFNDPVLLQDLEKIVHPELRKKIHEHYDNLHQDKLSKYSLFVVEIPLLYEAGWEKDYDHICWIDSSQDLCQQRFEQKTGRGVTEYERRASRFLSQEEKRLRASFVISNRGTVQALEKQVRDVFEKILFL